MKLFFSAIIFTITLSGILIAQAAGLKDYKAQKHGDRQRVDSDNCQPAYIADCSKKCIDDNCRSQCAAEAPKFCEDRSKRRFWKTAEVIGKGASVGAGALGVILDKDMPEVGPEGQAQIGPYSIIWNRPSVEMNLGMGIIEGGGKSGSLNFLYRHERFGFGTNSAYLWEDKDHLWETDVGPTWNIASASFLFTLQPSLLISQGNGVKTEYGAGMRSYTKFIMGQTILFADPMLGFINHNWAYHLRVGGTYRFTPMMGVSLAYEYRDVVDLNDLNVSSAKLQGASVYLNMRWN